MAGETAERATGPFPGPHRHRRPPLPAKPPARSPRYPSTPAPYCYVPSNRADAAPKFKVNWRPCWRAEKCLCCRALALRAARDEDDDLATERESDLQRVWRSRGHGEWGRGVDEEGDEAEDSPSHEGAMRARGEVSVELQGVPRLSARSSALYVQGVRWCINMQARSSASFLQGVRRGINLRARSYTL